MKQQWTSLSKFKMEKKPEVPEWIKFISTSYYCMRVGQHEFVRLYRFDGWLQLWILVVIYSRSTQCTLTSDIVKTFHQLVSTVYLLNDTTETCKTEGGYLYTVSGEMLEWILKAFAIDIPSFGQLKQMTSTCWRSIWLQYSRAISRLKWMIKVNITY